MRRFCRSFFSAGLPAHFSTFSVSAAVFFSSVTQALQLSGRGALSTDTAVIPVASRVGYGDPATTNLRRTNADNGPFLARRIYLAGQK